jgi:hypothetical protein
MALTIQKQPEIINLSGNQVEFVISSDTVVNSNHKINIQVYNTTSFGFINQLIGEEVLPVINNSASFDMADYMKLETPFDLTVLDLFDTVPQIFDSVNRVYFRIFETYNGDGIEYNRVDIGPRYAVNGGFSSIYLKNYIASGKKFYADFVLADKKFLSWAPDKKLTWNQHDFLFWVSLMSGYAYYKIVLTFNDATTEEIDSEQALVSIYKLAYINTSFLANSLDAYETSTKKIVSYTVQVFNASDVAITEAKTYYIDRTTYNFGRQFIFRNSLGGYDIIYLKGISENTNEIQRTVGYFQTKDAISFSEFNETYKAASGFLVTHYNDLGAAQRYITELFTSKEIYEIVGREIIPIISESNKVLIKRDNEFLFSFAFEYRYAQIDSYFAPLDTEQYLNPRIFYRDGIIEDVAPGATATVEFDVFMNANATVNFSLNWGNDVGTGAINSVSLVNGVPQTLTSTISVPGNVGGERLLTITDSLGGKYYIAYNVVEHNMLFNDGEEMLFNDDEEMLFNN